MSSLLATPHHATLSSSSCFGPPQVAPRQSGLQDPEEWRRPANHKGNRSTIVGNDGRDATNCVRDVACNYSPILGTSKPPPKKRSHGSLSLKRKAFSNTLCSTQGSSAKLCRGVPLAHSASEPPQYTPAASQLGPSNLRCMTGRHKFLNLAGQLTSTAKLAMASSYSCIAKSPLPSLRFGRGARLRSSVWSCTKDTSPSCV